VVILLSLLYFDILKTFYYTKLQDPPRKYKSSLCWYYSCWEIKEYKKWAASYGI